MPIFIDDREPVELVEGLRAKCLAVEVRHLESGDYVFGEVGIERKTVNDLYSSAMDRRLWVQLDTLRRTYKIPILIVEDFYAIKQLDKITLGILTTIILFWKQQIILTSNRIETVDWIKSLFLKYGVGKSGREPPAAVRKYKTVKEIRLEMVQCIPGVGPTIAARILDTIPNIFTTSYNPSDLRELLKSIKGLNRSALERLIEVKIHE